MRTLALALVLGAVAGASAAFPDDEASLLGKDAPALQTRDFLQSDGRTAVADYKGEVLFVERFATWCGPCIAQMPHLSKLTEEYGKKGFHAISITDEPRETVLKFLTQLNVTPIAYTMGCGGGADAYPAPGIPKGFLIGVDGKVIWEGQSRRCSGGLMNGSGQCPESGHQSHGNARSRRIRRVGPPTHASTESTARVASSLGALRARAPRRRGLRTSAAAHCA